MAVDHSARAAQVARIIAHAGNANTKSGLLSWAVPGTGAVIYFSANVAEEKRAPSELDRDESDEQTATVLVASSVFESAAPAFPRAGQAFTDAAGRKYRILKLLSPPYSYTAAFRCAYFTPPA